MILRAKIAELAATDATLQLPFGGELRTVSELKAQNVTLTAEDYAAIRTALGGGKRGRARARELVPVQCPTCGCRLTHFEPAQRPAYFAPTVSSAAHGKRCELEQAQSPTGPASADGPEPALAVEQPQVADINEGTGAAALDAPASEAVDELHDEAADEWEEVSAADVVEETAYFAIEDAPPADSERTSLRARLLSAMRAERPSDESSGAYARSFPHARDLLVQALNRSLPRDSKVRFRGQSYAVVAAGDLQLRDDGEAVAVYGRLCEAVWSEAVGRLTLLATPRSVQVWATASVPRTVLQVEAGEPIEAPLLRKPVPFLAFGKLKKLNGVCGIPVVRSDYFVPLHPLDALSTQMLSARASTLIANIEQRSTVQADSVDSQADAPPPAAPTNAVHEPSDELLAMDELHLSQASAAPEQAEQSPSTAQVDAEPAQADQPQPAGSASPEQALPDPLRQTIAPKDAPGRTDESPLAAVAVAAREPTRELQPVVQLSAIDGLTDELHELLYSSVVPPTAPRVDLELSSLQALLLRE